MNDLLINSVLFLSAIGVISGGILFIAAKKFKVFEDPKIDQVQEVLPQANCGGCGYPGCRNFAEAVVAAKDLADLFCPVGGNDTMNQVATIMGLAVEAKEPMVAVLRCNGTNEYSPQKIIYQGADSCVLAHNNFPGEGGCPYGCLGLEDCVRACKFDAMYTDQETGLPVVIEEKCTACGACVKACPRNIYELRPIGKDSKRVYVSCMNQEKGAPAKKNCGVACIGCSKCAKVYESGNDIVINNNLAYFSHKVDVENYGAELVNCCPTGSIAGVNIEGANPKRPRPKVPAKEKTEETAGTPAPTKTENKIEEQTVG